MRSTLIITATLGLTNLAPAQMFLLSPPMTVRFGVESDFDESTRIDNQHVDIELVYRSGGGFEGFFDGDVSGRLEFDTGHLYANSLTRLAMPSNPNFAFIGAAPGSTVWVMPQNQLSGRVFPGIAAESQSASDRNQMLDWNPGDPRGGANNPGKWHELQLLDARMPPSAQFSIWQTQTGNVTRWMSTFDQSIDATDRVYYTSGAHTHHNFGFTHVGTYEIDVQIRTFVNLNWLAGDTDLDGDVDFGDLLTLAQNYGTTRGMWWHKGDFGADGAVGFDDLLALAQNYGSAASLTSEELVAGQTLITSLVPEPSTILVMLAPGLLLRRDRR
jgi:hypothetical protein